MPRSISHRSIVQVESQKAHISLYYKDRRTDCKNKSQTSHQRSCFYNKIFQMCSKKSSLSVIRMTDCLLLVGLVGNKACLSFS